MDEKVFYQNRSVEVDDGEAEGKRFTAPMKWLLGIESYWAVEKLSSLWRPADWINSIPLTISFFQYDFFFLVNIPIWILFYFSLTTKQVC